MSASGASESRVLGADHLLRSYPYALAGSCCLGLAAANAGRVSAAGAVLAAGAAGLAALASDPRARIVALSVALLLAGWWWGSARLDALDASVLIEHVGEAEPTSLVVTGPARNNGFELRVPARLVRFGRIGVGEPVLLELPLGRSPPQGAILELVTRLKLPRPASHGFDERTWLRRHGVHVVAIGKEWRIVGRRSGLGGYADHVRAWLAGSLAPGLTGSGTRCSRESCWGRTRGCRPTCGTRSGPPASTTCSQSAVRT